MTARILFTVCLAGIASPVVAASPEVRGTWVTTSSLNSANSTLRTPAATEANFARLRAIGLNTVYVDAWRNGETYFRSNTMAAMGGTSLASQLGTRDLFAETLIQAHRNGMSQYAWLQYGFAAQNVPAGSQVSNSLALKAQANGWLLQDSSGATTNASNRFAWMNPLVPEVRQFIIGLGVELVTKYDVDGVQFDDRLAWPTEFGYDTYTRNAYLAETGRTVPANHADAAFTAWRAAKITAFAQEFSTAIRQANPNAKVAAAPGVYGVYAGYAVDSTAWAASTVTINGVTRPTFDEISPQIYNSTASGFAAVLDDRITKLAAPAETVVAAGISINNASGSAYNWSTVNQPQVHSQRTDFRTAGQIWWYSEGVLNSNESALTALYDVAANGHAARPDRAADYRPAPVVAASLGGGLFGATPDVVGRYSIIGFNGTTWSELLNTVLPDASIQLALGSYAKVELLVDRRGFIPGDSNFDRKVDLLDLAAWQANNGLTGKMWAQADFTLDGKVDEADLAVLFATWGTGVTGELAPLATLVPEPTMLTMLAPLAVAARRRRRSARS